MKRSKLFNRNTLVAAMLVGVISIGGIMAYFTDTDSETNTFTVGKVTIDQDEPNYPGNDTDKTTNITPNEVIPKDPTITNTGINDAFVFMTVTVPCADVVTANQEGVKEAKGVKDLFSYTVNSGWVQVGNKLDVKSGGYTVAHRYLYAWGDASKCTALTAGSKTKALFDNVTMINLIEGQTYPDGSPIETSTNNILIQSYAIQTEDLNGHDGNAKTAPADVWAIIDNQREVNGDFNADTSVDASAIGYQATGAANTIMGDDPMVDGPTVGDEPSSDEPTVGEPPIESESEEEQVQVYPGEEEAPGLA